MLRFVVNSIQEGKPFKILVLYIISTTVLQIIFNLVNTIYSTYFQPILARKSIARTDQIIYNKSLNMDYENFEDPSAYKSYKLAVSNGTSAFKGMMTWLASFLNITIHIGMNAWLILTIDPILTLFVLFPVLLGFVNTIYVKIAHEYDCSVQETERKEEYAHRIFYQKEYAKEIKLTNIGNVILRLFHESINEYIKLVKTKGLAKATLNFITPFGTEVVSVLGAECYAIYKTVVSGTILYGDCLVILNSISILSGEISQVGYMFSWLYELTLKTQTYRDFMEKPNIVKDNISGPLPTSGNIILRNVSFRYMGADNDCLKNISITIHKGEKIAIVGNNGAGKTTLTRLLMRLYDVTDGEILLNGKNIKEYPIQPYRKLFGTVFQDYKQIAVSIAENVLGREYHKEDENTVRDALNSAGLIGHIEEDDCSPINIHTAISREFDENGVVLSGGQSQKLAIASIYANNKEILILDEPSSALDPIAESELFHTMDRMCRKKTVIFISHRLSQAICADRIYVLENGTITEAGTHKELLEQNGKYAEMFRVQAENYID